MSAPVHRAEVGVASVRFVRSPEPGLDVPWVVATDVLRCLGAPDQRLVDLLRELRKEAPLRMARVEGSVLPTVPPWVLVLAAEAALGPRAKGAAIRAMRAAHEAAHPDVPPLARAIGLLSAPSAMP